MTRKKIWTDPSFWVLAGVNGYLILHYYKHPETFITLVWLYWAQSMLLGVFSVLDLLTVSNTTPITYKVNDVLTEFKDDGRSRWGSAKFFIIAYGGLHVFYLLFLLAMKKEQPIQWDLFRYFFLAFFAGQLLTFIQHKAQQRKQATNTGPIIFGPFIRVLPMHLTIVLANFFPVGSIGIFLVLKSLADVVTYALTRPSYKSRETDATMLATQRGMDM